MEEVKKHPTKNWEISIIELHDNGTKEYKVTRRLKDQEVQETKIFKTLEAAKKQFNEWLEV